MPQSRKYSFFLLFVLSGFSGLIYESIWSHYLKLFLGHAAYAQTLVLAIFMGGMAIGAWLSGLLSPRLEIPNGSCDRVIVFLFPWVTLCLGSQ